MPPGHQSAATGAVGGGSGGGAVTAGPGAAASLPSVSGMLGQALGAWGGPAAGASAPPPPPPPPPPPQQQQQQPVWEEREVMRALLRHERRLAKLHRQNRALRDALCKADPKAPVCGGGGDRNGGLWGDSSEG
jgi:hypothetical protein